jgi:ankyrin repeat protein
LESVRACLDAGADIDVQQEDKSTPVHFACVRGELQIVQLMFEKQANKKLRVLGMADMNGVTPLHKAALLDHADLVQLLIEEVYILYTHSLALSQLPPRLTATVLPHCHTRLATLAVSL